jgi:hypothetical protein
MEVRELRLQKFASPVLKVRRKLGKKISSRHDRNSNWPCIGVSYHSQTPANNYRTYPKPACGIGCKVPLPARPRSLPGSDDHALSFSASGPYHLKVQTREIEHRLDVKPTAERLTIQKSLGDHDPPTGSRLFLHKSRSRQTCSSLHTSNS